MQTSTTPDPGYQWESDKLTVRHHNREPRGQLPFYHIRWAPLSVTIFIRHVRILRNGSFDNEDCHVFTSYKIPTLSYKMSNNPLIPQPAGAISRYNLWNSNDLQTLEARTSLYYHTNSLKCSKKAQRNRQHLGYGNCLEKFAEMFLNAFHRNRIFDYDALPSKKLLRKISSQNLTVWFLAILTIW